MASMSGAPRVRSLNIAEPEGETDVEARPVLVPGGNKAKSGPMTARKPAPKPLRKAATATAPERPVVAAVEEKKDSKKNGGGGGAAKGSSPVPSPRGTPPAPLRKQDVPLHLNLSLNASCSSDASIESFRSRASTGRIGRVGPVSRPRPSVPKREKAVAKVENGVSDGEVVLAPELAEGRRKCAWVTPTTDPYYAAFHDEEWGVPVHDDKRLFELLVLSGALAELTWPEILKKRNIFREVFMGFDPVAVSRMNEKRILAPGSIASSLLSEQKLRAIIENARQILKIVDEFGSFDQYCWGFLNYKPAVSKFRYPRQVPVKSPKADLISKELVRRDFRSVGPTIIYSFMQAAGLTNDHLVSCFRFEECNAAATLSTDETNRIKAKPDLKTDGLTTKIGNEVVEETTTSAELSRAMNSLIVS